MKRKSAMKDDPSAEFIKVFLAGAPGTGKSRFGSTFPTPGFVFDFGENYRAFRGKDFDYVQYPKTSSGWLQYERDFRDIREAVKKGEYISVIHDDCTGFADMAMEHAMALDPKRSVEKGPIWNVHYQIVKNLVAPKLRVLSSFPCHVLINCHHKLHMDSDTGAIMKIEPLLTGDLPTRVPGSFGEMYCSFVKAKGGKPYYYLRLVPLGHYQARSLISGEGGLLPPEIPNSFKVLLSEYQKALDEFKKQKKGSQENGKEQKE